MSGFENINVQNFLDVLAEILSDKHGVKVTFTARKKTEAKNESISSL